MSSRLAKSPRSFPLQDKVALAYLSLTISEVSPGSGKRSHLMGFFSSARALDSDTLTWDLDVILDFIHWSQSVSSRLWSRGMFSHSVQPCVAHMEVSRFPRSQSLSLHGTGLTPSLALVYPPFINLPPSYPHSLFIMCPFFTHPKHQGLLLREYHAFHRVHKHTLTGQPNSCFLIKSKQPLTELLPRYLKLVSHLINP